MKSQGQSVPRLLVTVSCALAAAIPAASVNLKDVAVLAGDTLSTVQHDEPSIAVNPLNPQQIAIVAFSGNWGPSANAPVWKSDDGGNTWRKVPQLPQPAARQQGPGDQKIAFDRSGKLYVAELAVDSLNNFFDYVYRQNGAADAVMAVGASYGNDQPHLDIDKASGACLDRLYSPWLNTNIGLNQSNVEASGDFGGTVSAVAAGDNSSFANRTTRIALAPDGKAYIVYKTREGAVDSTFEKAHFHVKRSDDCGATWNALGASGSSVTGATQVQTYFTQSFGAGAVIQRARSSDAWIAVDPVSGDVYVSYVRKDASGFGQVYVARSANHGSSWASARVSDGTHNSAFPQVAVTQHGAIGVLYLDFDTTAGTTTYRHHFAQSVNLGAGWSDEILQSMDPTGFPNIGLSAIEWGDYEGLTAAGSTFYGVFTGASIGRATAQYDPIFFRVGPEPQIQVPGAVDLGKTCLGAAGAGTLNVCNTGKDDLVVSAITSSDPAFAVTTPSSGYPVTISPDFCFPFQVAFSAAAAGAQSATLTIASNDPKNPNTKVKVSGDGTQPEIRVTGSTDFGVVSAWRPGEKTVAVCNTGGCDLSVTSAATSCADFTLIHNPFPAKVSHDSCLDLVVRFTPGQPGFKSCSLTIASDDPSNPSVTRTLTGRTPPLISVDAGMAIPHGAFHGFAKRGSTFNLAFVQPWAPQWAWDVRLGFSRFDGRGAQPDTDLATLSANARFTVNPAGVVRLYFNGGLGLYDFRPGDFNGGGNLGAGLGVPLGRRFGLEATYNFHSAFTTTPKLNFSQIQLGLLVSF
jgi:hypothetical protein